LTIVQHVHVVAELLDPTILANVVDVDDATTHSVTVSGMEDGSLAEFYCLLDSEILSVVGIKDTVGVGRARTSTEQVTSKTSALVVDVEELWSSVLVPAGDHCAHGQTVASILIDNVAKNLRSSCNADSLVVFQLPDATLLGEDSLPVRAISSTTGHGTEQVRRDLNHLLDSSTADVAAHRSSAIDGDQNTMLEDESKSGGTVCHLDVCVHWVCVTGSVDVILEVQRARNREC